MRRAARRRAEHTGETPRTLMEIDYLLIPAEIDRMSSSFEHEDLQAACSVP